MQAQGFKHAHGRNPYADVSLLHDLVTIEFVDEIGHQTPISNPYNAFRMKEVFISRPYVEERGDWVAVCSTVTLDGVENKLWFEVPSTYAKYLVVERADAFLVAALPMIARRGGRVRVEAPISSMLLHNLRNLLSPCMPLLSSEFSELSIEAEANDAMMHPYDQFHVGTGCSCGVDSMASYRTYSEHNNTPREMLIDNLVFFDGGQHDDVSPSEPLEVKVRCHDSVYLSRLKQAQEFALAIGLPLIEIRSSLSYFHDGWGHSNLHTFRDAACILAVQKYFSAYHFASAVHVKHFKFTISDPAYCEEFLLRCLSTESTRLYSSLATSTRYERTKMLCDFAPARRMLNVCTHGFPNCGRCFKCVRTMLQLDLMGKLEAFEGVFDTTFYHTMDRQELAQLELQITNDVSYKDEMLHYAAQPDANPHAVFNYDRLVGLYKRADNRKALQRSKQKLKTLLRPVKRIVKWVLPIK